MQLSNIYIGTVSEKKNKQHTATDDAGQDDCLKFCSYQCFQNPILTTGVTTQALTGQFLLALRYTSSQSNC